MRKIKNYLWKACFMAVFTSIPLIAADNTLHQNPAPHPTTITPQNHQPLITPLPPNQMNHSNNQMNHSNTVNQVQPQKRPIGSPPPGISRDHNHVGGSGHGGHWNSGYGGNKQD